MAQLVEIHPSELKFRFEAKKQSSCAIQLVNVSDQYVAFKVKTTSSKKYCVRPNMGVIKPNLTGDFTVTMQAQRSPPSDMQCKDKFLIQTIVVPFGTTEKDISPIVFSKDSCKHIEEFKLRVVLNSPPRSPVLLPINGVLEQEPSHETSIQKDKLLRGVENPPPPHVLDKDVEDVNNFTLIEEARPVKVVKDNEFRSVKDAEPRRVKDVEGTKLKLIKEIEDLNLKLNVLDSKMNVLDAKLIEAECTISKLKEEKSTTILEKEMIKLELAVLRRNSGVRRVEVGFPMLFVSMVALLGLTFGYLLHP